MSECKHQLAEQDTYVADGYCPLCLLDDIQHLQAKVDALEKELSQARAGCYACEPVALENERLRAENGSLVAIIQEVIAKAALAEVDET